jgi:predicted nucleotidyltransferase component of viral defense system
MRWRSKEGPLYEKLVFGAAGRFSEDMDFVILADDYDSIQTELMVNTARRRSSGEGRR